MRGVIPALINIISTGNPIRDYEKALTRRVFEVESSERAVVGAEMHTLVTTFLLGAIEAMR